MGWLSCCADSERRKSVFRIFLFCVVWISPGLASHPVIIFGMRAQKFGQITVQ